MRNVPVLNQMNVKQVLDRERQIIKEFGYPSAHSSRLQQLPANPKFKMSAPHSEQRFVKFYTPNSLLSSTLNPQSQEGRA